MKNELITKVGSKIIGVASRAGLTLKKYSPEILLGVGVISVIGGTILACRATLRIDDVLAEYDEVKEKMDRCLEESKEPDVGYEYTDEMYKRDNAIQTIQTGFKVVKLYSPAILVLGVGVACLLGSHHILKSRNFALMAAYNVLSDSFTTYRDRVRDDQGSDKDLEYLHGVKGLEKTKTTIDENGENKDCADEDLVPWNDANHTPSMYSKIFDESSIYWQKNSELNKIFLSCQQNYANDRLNEKGHVFLNEVYDMLGMEHTKAGAIVGWVKGPNNSNYIDFGLYNLNRVKNNDFINGYERSVLLDFNVDGVIYDKI